MFFLVWMALHVLLALRIVGMFSHILHYGFAGIESYIISAGAVFVVIAVLKCIFVPKW